MVTGDHKLTAEAIGRELGILEPGLMVLTGAELDQMSDEELDSVIEKVAVFARVTPLHKYRIVESLRRKGHIVAMTGDGVNDAPALKKAEIGIAIGITGTDVAKEASDMILMDDNFASIVNAVKEGRVIFDNIRKVVKYLLSTDTGEIVAISGTLLFLPKTPLIFTPVQILWVNLVSDGLHNKFLAMEPKERGVMNRQPRDPRESIVDKDMLLGIMFVSVFMAAGAIFMFNLVWSAGDLERVKTLGLTTMAMFQISFMFGTADRLRHSFANVIRIGSNILHNQ